jgi:hypothetical protein
MNHLYILLANNLTVGGTGDSKKTFYNTTLTTTTPIQFHRYSGPVPLDGRFCVLTARQTLKSNTTIYNIKPHSQSFISSKPATMSNMGSKTDDKITTLNEIWSLLVIFRSLRLGKWRSLYGWDIAVIRVGGARGKFPSHREYFFYPRIVFFGYWVEDGQIKE